jgi:ABC-type Zn2+ transport system substrate-binding protein/surface adhesin
MVRGTRTMAFDTRMVREMLEKRVNCTPWFVSHEPYHYFPIHFLKSVTFSRLTIASLSTAGFN